MSNCAPDLPFATVIMPVFNEERFIAQSLGAVLAQDYPLDRMEIIVVDGMSTDRTREIVTAIQEQYPIVRLVDNPKRIVPTGLNLALKGARGDVIVRVDGHTILAKDFVRISVSVLEEHPEAWSVGGPSVHSAYGTFGKAVAAAMSHPFGVGDAFHRFTGYEGYAEGAAFPAIRRWVFDRVGAFDERLVRNQDDEFNFRMTQAGGKIFVTPRIRYAYYVRENVRHLFRQYFQYGYWKIPVMRKHRRPTAFRQIIPPAFIVTIAFLVVLGVNLQKPGICFAVPVLYTSALVVAASLLAQKVGIRVACHLPLAFATMHTAYGFGILFSMVSRLFSSNRPIGSGSMSKISR